MTRIDCRILAAACLLWSMPVFSRAADWPSSSCPGNACGAANAAGRPGVTERLSRWYDPCWPERYSFAARQTVISAFAQQTLNGHILNQTIWNYHFEPGTDRLTPAGIEKIDSLLRIRPTPDNKIYIQTARDLPVVASNVEQVQNDRSALDLKRANVIAKYLAGSIHKQQYEIYVHDPIDPSIGSAGPLNAYRNKLTGFVGNTSVDGRNFGIGPGGPGTAPQTTMQPR